MKTASRAPVAYWSPRPASCSSHGGSASSRDAALSPSGRTPSSARPRAAAVHGRHPCVPQRRGDERAHEDPKRGVSRVRLDGVRVGCVASVESASRGQKSWQQRRARPRSTISILLRDLAVVHTAAPAICRTGLRSGWRSLAAASTPGHSRWGCG